MDSLTSKEYKNEFVQTFDGEDTVDKKPRQTPGVLYSRAAPTPVKKPTLLAWSEELGQELGIKKPETQEEVDVLGGNNVTPSMKPYAACYAGHQFGNWAGQLGDGRAMTLGEWETPGGESWELQLKGAGPTAYSRRADGRAVLRSSVREYLMSEAMHYLGVPTTRALSLVATGDQIVRDMFYNGNPEYEPGAIVLRTAPSFLRFGSFEMPAARQETDNLRALVDWTMSRYYPHIQGEDRVMAWFREIVDRTAHLMVEWMRVGFVHGVMNTDNMSILGLTIDYGPFSFLDDYDPLFTPNTTDLPGRRYAFARQPPVAQWNLGCLASALAPLFPNTKQLIAELEAYEGLFHQKYVAMLGNKMGLDEVREEDPALMEKLELMLTEVKPDMTLFYQLLIDLPTEVDKQADILQHFQESFYADPSTSGTAQLVEFVKEYSARLGQNSISREESKEKMEKANPRIILRNYMLHQAIEELSKGQDTLFKKLQEAMKKPYSRDYDEFFQKRPDWATQKAGCSMLSCSS